MYLLEYKMFSMYWYQIVFLEWRQPLYQSLYPRVKNGLRVLLDAH